jgi:hypothetical protein
LASISLTSPAEVGGLNNVYASAYGVVNLATPAGNSGVVVNLTSSDPALYVPKSVTILSGQTSSDQFYMQTSAVKQDTAVTITATTSSSTITAVFYVDVPFQVTTTPASVIGGQSSTGRITIGTAAPSGGVTFTLSSFGKGIGVPATATIPAGAKTVTFPITTIAAADYDLWGEVYAADPNGAPMEADLSVDSSWTVQDLFLSLQSVSGGSLSSLTVVLNGPAPADGEQVTLSCSDTSTVTIPGAVIVPSGQTSLYVPVSTSAVSVATSVVISATIANPNYSTSSVQLEVTPALPGITYTLLNPANATNSAATAIAGATQGGSASNQIAIHAGIWQRTANSFLDLNPGNWTDSVVAGLSGNVQVGSVSNSLSLAPTHAALWQGTAESFVDLNPAAAAGSWAHGVSGGTVVGNVLVNVTNSGQTQQVSHASAWAGSAASFVDLDPQGKSGSAALAVDGKAVVGFLANKAALWSSGTAASYVNLQPSNWSQSAATGVSGNTQVGSVGSASNVAGPHASRWTGTAASFLDLNPVGVFTSQATGVSGEIVVGTVTFYPYNQDFVYPVHAAIWSGDASTFIDLEAAVGASWAISYASGVYSDSTGIYVVGSCDAGAILWHIPPGLLPQVPSQSPNDKSKPK